MITDNVKKGRHAAAGLEEARAAKLAIARELPIASEMKTSACNIALNEKAKEEAKALVVVEDDSVLVDLVEKYVSAKLPDEGESETWRCSTASGRASSTARQRAYG